MHLFKKIKDEINYLCEEHPLLELIFWKPIISYYPSVEITPEEFKANPTLYIEDALGYRSIKKKYQKNFYELRWHLWYYWWKKYINNFGYKYLINYQHKLVTGSKTVDKKYLIDFNFLSKKDQKRYNNMYSYCKLAKIFHINSSAFNSISNELKYSSYKQVQKVYDRYCVIKLCSESGHLNEHSFGNFALNLCYNYSPDVSSKIKTKKHLFALWITGKFSIIDFIKDFFKYFVFLKNPIIFHSDKSVYENGYYSIGLNESTIYLLDEDIKDNLFEIVNVKNKELNPSIVEREKDYSRYKRNESRSHDPSKYKTIVDSEFQYIVTNFKWGLNNVIKPYFEYFKEKDSHQWEQIKKQISDIMLIE